MSSVKRFHPGRIQGVAESLASETHGIENALRVLDTEVSRLRGDWTGAASDAYDSAQTEWTARLQAMNAVLAQASKSADIAAVKYEEGRARIRARWGR